MDLDVPQLRDEVIALRIPAMRDVDAVTDACQDADIPRFTRVPSPYGRPDAVAFVEQTARSWDDGTGAIFAITGATDDRLLGSVGLVHIREDHTSAEIGYWVARDARRQGIATRAVRLVSRWAVCELGIARVELMTRVENAASQRVAVAAGYTREGLLRSYATLHDALTDVVMFSLLPRDLEPGEVRPAAGSGRRGRPSPEEAPGTAPTDEGDE